MDREPPCSTVLIDWFGTITVPMIDVALELASVLGHDTASRELALRALAEYTDDRVDNPFHAAERGELDIDDLRRHLDELAPGAGGAVGPHSPSILDAADRPEMTTLLRDLTDAGVTVVVATNNFSVNQETLARRYLDTGLAVALVNSALIGVRKPDPAFFEICLEVCDTGPDDDPARVVAVDDQQTNLDVAADLGLRTVLVGADASEAVAEIRQLTLG